jgi:hypothetical protein
MEGFLPVLVTLAAFAVTLGGFAWFSIRARARGVGSSFVGPFQELWDPSHLRSDTEIRIEVARKAPAPSPGDPPWLEDEIS